MRRRLRQRAQNLGHYLKWKLEPRYVTDLYDERAQLRSAHVRMDRALRRARAALDRAGLTEERDDITATLSRLETRQQEDWR